MCSALLLVSAAVDTASGMLLNHHTLLLQSPGQVDAGVDKDLVFGDPTAPRFVFWERKLRATPSGPDALTFDLLSLWGKIRAGLGAVGIVKGGPMPGQCTSWGNRSSIDMLAAAAAAWEIDRSACMQHTSSSVQHVDTLGR